MSSRLGPCSALLQPPLDSSLPKVDTLLVEAPAAQALVTRPRSKASDDTPTDGDPSVDISYAALQAHRIVNVALHWEYYPVIVFV
jgi:hypothetical protein